MENLQESSLSRIYSKAKNHAVGAITAFRGDKTKKENKENNQKLLASLMSSGFSVTKVKGSYIENYETEDAKEVGEESFFVANMEVDGDDKGKLEKELIRLGKFFDQDSILSVRFEQPAVLIGTSKRENAFPSFGEKFEVGTLKMGESSGEFFSRVKGRKFAFESVEEIERPETYFGKWAMAMMAKNLNEEIDSLT